MVKHRKTLCLFLVIVMIISLLPAVPAFAYIPAAVTSITITAVEPAEGGTPAATAVIAAEPAEAVNSASVAVTWYNFTPGKFITEPETPQTTEPTSFVKGSLYAAVPDLSAVIADGYEISDDTVITMNGQDITSGYSVNGNYGAILGPVGVTLVTKLAIQTTELKVGTVTASSATVTAQPSDAVILPNVSLLGWAKTTQYTPAPAVGALFKNAAASIVTAIEGDGFYLPIPAVTSTKDVIGAGYGINPALTEITLNGEALYDADYIVKALAPKNAFVDVAEGSFYEDAVDWAVQNHITNGTSDTAFSPDESCSRAQAVTFIWRACGSPEPTLAECPYTDVKTTAFYYKAMLWATQEHITKGTSETTFSPEKCCSRGEAVTLLWRAAGAPAPTVTECPYTDVKTTAFYYEAMLWAVENHITNGLDATTFGPGDACLRSQIVTFLYRRMVPPAV